MSIMDENSLKVYLLSFERSFLYQVEPREDSRPKQGGGGKKKLRAPRLR